VPSAGVKSWAANANPDQRTWTRSPKAHAQVYTDEAALGCPLRSSAGPTGRGPASGAGIVGGHRMAAAAARGGELLTRGFPIP
jgi:hypothetical protein